MKRFSLFAGLAIVASLASGLPAQALPTPDAGGPAALLRYVGDPSSATGNSVSNGDCDVNGDDFNDAVVGAWFWDKAPTNNIGAAYVLFGGKGVAGGDLSDPADVGAVRIDGPSVASASVGFSVGCLGDVNGDGYDDLGVGDYLENRAIVIFGAANFTPLSLDAIGDRGFVVREPFTSSSDRSNLSFSMAKVGDINDDGKDDFALAAVVADTQGRNNNGKVWVLRGRDDISDVDLSSPGNAVLLTVDGALAEERLGALASAGDVNGDGVSDFILGSYTSTPWGSTISVPGAAYVVFGGNAGAIDAANLGTKGFAIYGPKRQRDRLGISVSALGDINEDGRADLLIGADGVNNAATGPRSGSAVVVWGSYANDTVYTDPTAPEGETVYTCETPETLAVSCADPSRRGYWINGEANSDSLGYSVAGLGDVNGDSIPDLALGAWGFDPINPDTSTAMSGAGATYVVFGRYGGGSQNLTGLAATAGYRIDGLKAGDRFGRQVGRIGDFDGNGVRDLVAAGDFASRTAATGAQNGELTVALMGKLKPSIALTGPATARVLTDVTLTATITKPGGAVSEGTVAFARNGTTIPSCATAPVTSGVATCTFNDADESAQDYVATFSGTDTVATETSATHPLVISKESTTTSLTTSLADAKPGQLVQLKAGVLGETNNAIDSGAVKFLADGESITGCKSVTVSEGDAVCTTSWSSKGSVDVTAQYLGTDRVRPSESGATTVSIGSDSVIRPDAVPSLTYGTKVTPFTGEVRGYDSTPTGSIELRNGSTVLGTATLSDGEYSITFSSKALQPGAHTLTLRYNGDDTTNEAERSIAVTVARATSRITTSKPTSVVANKTVAYAVKVYPQGLKASGAVQINLDGKAYRTTTVSDGKGTYRLRFTKAGTRKISVKFLGSKTMRPSAWVTFSVKVK